MQPREQDNQAEWLSTGLGLFSIGLGLAEVAAPRQLARLIGLRDDADTASMLRTYGAREIGNGVAILSQPDRAAWLWARVGGDAIDLSSLGSALMRSDTNRGRAAAATAAVAGVAVLDILAARHVGERGASRRARSTSVRVEHVQTINRPIEEVYRFWHDFQNFPRFMRHLQSVQITGERRSRWRARGPAGLTVEWEAEMLEDREPEWIAWRSLEGSDVRNSGSVRFARAPGARGTEVRVQLQYDPPAGAVGRGLAWLFGEEPDIQVKEDLHRFKQLMEAGEIPLSDGPGLWRAAQPARHPEQVRSLAGVHQ